MRNERQTRGFAVLFLCVVWAVGGVVSAAHAQGDPVAGAKRAVAVMRNARTLKEAAGSFTNESAATMGLLMSFAMNYGLLEEGRKDQAKRDAASADKPEDAATKAKRLEMLARIKQLNEELNRILTKYGARSYINNPFALMMRDNRTGRKTDSIALPPRLRRLGRTMLIEVADAYTQMDVEGGNKAFADFNKKNDWLNSAKMRYKALGPTRVAITDTRQKTGAANWEARYEEGAWRLHLPIPTKSQP